MNPQTPIEQVSDETLGLFAWRLREQHDLVGQQLVAIRQEFARREQQRQGQAREAADAKAQEQDALVNKLLSRLNKPPKDKVENGQPAVEDGAK